jgi:hypothetical protein
MILEVRKGVRINRVVPVGFEAPPRFDGSNIQLARHSTFTSDRPSHKYFQEADRIGFNAPFTFVSI